MFRTAPLAALIACAFASALRAEVMPDNLISAELLPGWRLSAGEHVAGLKITLAEGWKTYWRAPGDAGIPPSFDWTRSTGIGAVAYHWPEPEVFHVGGMRSVGYVGGLVLPMTFTLAGNGEARAEAVIELGVCDTICVPATVRVSATLDPDGRRDPEIVAALIDQPVGEDKAGVGTVSCAFDVTESGLRLTARVEVPPATGPEEVVIEAGDPAIWVSEPVLTRAGHLLTATAEIARSDGAALAVDRSAILLTILGGPRAIEIQGCPAG